MAKISRMQPGQVLYSVIRQRMGNTTVSIGSLYRVKIIEVDPQGEWVVASWNGNQPQKYSQRQANKWKVKEPTPKRKVMGMNSY